MIKPSDALHLFLAQPRRVDVGQPVGFVLRGEGREALGVVGVSELVLVVQGKERVGGGQHGQVHHVTCCHHLVGRGALGDLDGH